MNGMRGILGRTMIKDALSSFESMSKRFEIGIEHCKAEIINHQKDILDKNTKIKELDEHVGRANRVLGKIKEFIA